MEFDLFDAGLRPRVEPPMFVSSPAGADRGAVCVPGTVRRSVVGERSRCGPGRELCADGRRHPSQNIARPEAWTIQEEVRLVRFSGKTFLWCCVVFLLHPSPVLLTKKYRRCSILFHLFLPGGKWLTVMDRPVSSASRCNSSFHSRTRDPLLPPPSGSNQPSLLPRLPRVFVLAHRVPPAPDGFHRE